MISEGNIRATARTDTQREAIEIAREITRKNELELISTVLMDVSVKEIPIEMGHIRRRANM